MLCGCMFASFVSISMWNFLEIMCVCVILYTLYSHYIDSGVMFFIENGKMEENLAIWNDRT